MENLPDPVSLNLRAFSRADALGYLGQKAVADAAVAGKNYRIIGGHMVRLLLNVYPTPEASIRSTLDSDAAVDDVQVVGELSEALQRRNFEKRGGNVFYQKLSADEEIEINLLLARAGGGAGLGKRKVEGVGEVDTLRELHLVMAMPPVVLDVSADLGDMGAIQYRTMVPDVEAAVMLKAHSWQQRRNPKDLVDLKSLLEIRQEHPEISWGLNEKSLRGMRKDTAGILHDLSGRLLRRNQVMLDHGGIDRVRMAALINTHVTRIDR